VLVSLETTGWELLTPGWDPKPILDEAIPRMVSTGTRHHVRDVLQYERTDGGIWLHSKENNWFWRAPHADPETHVPRFDFLSVVAQTASDILEMIPQDAQRDTGELHLDVFRSFKGTVVDEHADRHGGWIMSWVMDRQGGGGALYLRRCNTGIIEVERALETGEALMFVDFLFFHGVRALDGEYRDVLIFTTIP